MKLIIWCCMLLVLCNLIYAYTEDVIVWDNATTSINGTATTNGMSLFLGGWKVMGGNSPPAYDDAIGTGGSRGITVRVNNGTYWNNASMDYDDVTLVFSMKLTNSVPADPMLSGFGLRNNGSDEQYNHPGVGIMGANYGNFSRFNLFACSNGYNGDVITTATLDTNWHKFLLLSNQSGVYLYEDNLTNEIAKIVEPCPNSKRDGIGMNMFAAGNDIYYDDIYLCDGSTDCSVELESDSCTYSGSGNHTYQASDDCIINSQVDMMGNNILVNGSGTLTLNAAIINWTDINLIGINTTHRANVLCNSSCFGG